MMRRNFQFTIHDNEPVAVCFGIVSMIVFECANRPKRRSKGVHLPWPGETSRGVWGWFAPGMAIYIVMCVIFDTYFNFWMQRRGMSVHIRG